MDLPKFNGDPVQWRSWYEQFIANVDETELQDISKFGHLKALVEGKAKTCIEGIPYVARNYKIAIEMLVKRFGKPTFIKQRHVQLLVHNELVPGRLKGQEYIDVLWNWYDKLNANLRALKELGVDEETFEIFLTPMILGRLPENLRHEWSKGAKGKEHNIEHFLTFIHEEIERLERAELFGNMSISKPPPESIHQEIQKTATAAALVSSSGGIKCDFCGKPHYNDQCKELLAQPLESRFEKIASLQLCFRCLRRGHRKVDCRTNVKCKSCGFMGHNAQTCIKTGNQQPRQQQNLGWGSNPQQTPPGYQTTHNEIIKQNNKTIKHKDP